MNGGWWKSAVRSLAVIAVLAAAAPAVAGQVVVSGSWNGPIDGGGVVFLPAFNPALGMLEGAEISFNIDVTDRYAITSGNLYPEIITAQVSNTVGLGLGGPRTSVTAYDTVSLGPYETMEAVFAYSAAGSFFLPATDMHFDASRGLIAGILSQNPLPQFIAATGPFSLSFDANDFERYTGNITVAYDFIPVPEPGTLTLAAIASLVGFGWMWRRGRRRA
jgi:hypothetical protein